MRACFFIVFLLFPAACSLPDEEALLELRKKPYRTHRRIGIDKRPIEYDRTEVEEQAPKQEFTFPVEVTNENTKLQASQGGDFTQVVVTSLPKEEKLKIIAAYDAKVSIVKNTMVLQGTKLYLRMVLKNPSFVVKDGDQVSLGQNLAESSGEVVFSLSQGNRKLYKLCIDSQDERLIEIRALDEGSCK